MNTAIREKRKISFQDVIITPAIIRRIALIVHAEAQVEHADFSDLIENYSVDALDESSYESQSIGIFEQGQIVDTKVLDKVQMQFYTKDNSKKIEVQIEHSIDDEKSNSFIMVSGDDSVWVNGVHAQLWEIINEAEEPAPIRKYLFGILFGAIFIINYYYFIFFYKDIQRIKYDWLEGAMVLLPIIVGIIILNKSQKYIDEMYPTVELQTGYQHHQIAFVRRKRLTLFATIFLFPIITAVIYDALKNWL